MTTLGATLTTVQYVMPDGWISANETWTFASASSFTVSGVDVTAKLRAGTKLRLKQGGGYKYFQVSSSSFSTNTTVNVDVNTDYTIANSAITDNDFSYMECPQGFPSEFNWTPSFSNWTIGTGGSAGTTARYRRVDKYIYAEITTTLGTSGASVGTNVTFNLPVTARSALLGADNFFLCGGAQFLDSGVNTYFGFVRLNATTTAQVLVSLTSGTHESGAAVSSTAPHSWNAGDGMTLTFSYPAA